MLNELVEQSVTGQVDAPEVAAAAGTSYEGHPYAAVRVLYSIVDTGQQDALLRLREHQSNQAEGLRLHVSNVLHHA